jgi:hypothetical protein
VLAVARQARRVAVDSKFELLRVIEEVHKDGQPRILERSGTPVAAIVHIDDLSGVLTAEPTPTDVAAGLAMAGSWEDVDVVALKRSIREGRRAGNRPVSRPA